MLYFQCGVILLSRSCPKNRLFWKLFVPGRDYCCFFRIPVKASGKKREREKHLRNYDGNLSVIVNVKVEKELCHFPHSHIPHRSESL